MFTTTGLIALQMVYVKKLPVLLALGFFLAFGFFDGLQYAPYVLSIC